MLVINNSVRDNLPNVQECSLNMLFDILPVSLHHHLEQVIKGQSLKSQWKKHLEHE
jgi:hypothetical protein